MLHTTLHELAKLCDSSYSDGSSGFFLGLVECYIGKSAVAWENRMSQGLKFFFFFGSQGIPRIQVIGLNGVTTYLTYLGGVGRAVGIFFFSEEGS